MNPIPKVVVAAPTFLSTFHTAIQEHLRKWLRPDEMMLQSVTDEPELQTRTLSQGLVRSRPRALIAITIRPAPEVLAAYAAAGIPIVLIDEDAPGVPSVAIDNFVGGRMVGEYFASKGRKRVAAVSGPLNVKGSFSSDERMRGFQAALESRKIVFSQSALIEAPHFSREDGLAAAPTLAALGIDAVFCAAGDICATGLLLGFRQRQLRVPDDIAVVGYDDLMMAQIARPALTTVKQPLERMAEVAYRIAVLEGARAIGKGEKVKFPPELVVRQSA
jgi:DNA-binding LacI/PurR family transcriptional regulator